MSRPLVRVMLLMLVSIVGIAGMLMAQGAWDGLFLAMAAAPLASGGGMLLARRARAALRKR